jgi:O-antigen ligase
MLRTTDHLLQQAKLIFVFLGMVVVTYAISKAIVSVTPLKALLFALGLLILILAFLKTEFALYVLILSMLLSPEIPVVSTPGRNIVIRIDDLLLFLIAASWFTRSALFKETGLIVKTPLNRSIFIYITVCLLSTTLGTLFGRVTGVSGYFFVLKYLEFFIVFFVTVNNLSSMKQIQRFVFFLFLTGIIIAIIALLQIPAGERVSAPFEGEQGEPNTLGGYMVLLTSLALGMSVYTQSLRNRLILFGMVGLFIIPIIYTFSRSSWLALVPMFMVFLFFVKMRTKVLLATFCFFLIILAPSILPERAIERFSGSLATKESLTKTYSSRVQKQFATVGGVAIDRSASSRIFSYTSILEDLKNHPIFGYGVGGYRFVDGLYFKILIDTGMLGFSALMFLFFKIFQQTRATAKYLTHSYLKGISLGALASVCALYAHALSSNTFIIVRIMEPFWFIMAIVIMSPRIEYQEIYQHAAHGQGKHA